MANKPSGGDFVHRHGLKPYEPTTAPNQKSES